MAFGTQIDAPTAECVGYKFMGWATSKDSEVAPIAETMPDKDVTYYAIWEARDDIQYIVRFKPGEMLGMKKVPIRIRDVDELSVLR